MLVRMQYEILQRSGRNVTALLAPMLGEAELFASPNTLQEVERELLIFSQTLAHLPDAMRRRLVQVDWHGWGHLQSLLEANRQPRRAEVWYATQALIPATLTLLRTLRKQDPVWFEIDF